VPQGWSLFTLVQDVVDIKNMAADGKKSNFVIIQKQFRVNVTFTKIIKIYCDKRLIY
jgi:hypothetical protein